ncbi:MAG: ornithine carbamoyltransferase [Spirochaetaceae bacterium]
MKLQGRSLLTLAEYSREEVEYLIELAERLKKESREGTRARRFEGLSIALLFEKRSTRTRCAFETAFGEEGGHPVFLSNADIQLGAKETIEDTARVLGRMFDAIQFRGFEQKTVETLATYSGVPVYNGLTDLYHPTQALADLMTLKEEVGTLNGAKLSFVGDGRNNVANSLLIACSLTGVNICVSAPEELQPEDTLVKLAEQFAKSSGATVEITTEVEDAVRDADAIYTDVWYSMGEESKERERRALLGPYQVNEALFARANPPVFLHCLPAVRGNEVTPGVIDGPHSRVWEEAENRKHTIKAVMLATLGRV